MGKGGGCMPSKSKKSQAAAMAASSGGGGAVAAAPESPAEEISETAPAAAEAEIAAEDRNLRIFVVFYSMYGHVEALARGVKRGVEEIDGVEAVLYRVPETLPEEVLDRMEAPAKDPEIPVIAAATDLEEADGILFGFPTRFGAMAAQMKAFFDATGQSWREQKLAGKPAGFFVSTGTQGGGQETTAWTAITQLAHHGMLFVPIGYTFGAGMFKMESIRGGSPYGAGTFSADGSRLPSETEIALAEHQGRYMAAVVKRLCLPPPP